jgi:flavodoxin
MPKIPVLYHSTSGHVEAMAEAVAETAMKLFG